MRGLDTDIRKIRRRIFKEVANFAYNSENLTDDIEALPYSIVDYDAPEHRESVYRERAVVRERIRLAMGMSLRPENKPVPVSQGVEASNIAEKYYEPPLIQVIPSACNACPLNTYKVTDACMGCVAHPCKEVCPKGAVFMENGHSNIDPDKCIRCGKCKSACPYDAISHRVRPCAAACGVNAIKEDSHKKAVIDNHECVSCGMCMVSCPFGAIADKSQIFQMIRAMKSGKKIVAQVAPAFAGQFGAKVTPDMIKTALKMIGFIDVYETAIGADMGAVAEAEHYVHKIATGEQEFLLTSCCPSWSVLAKRFFPDRIESISNALTPMVATARKIKEDYTDAGVVFIGPCASKKLEAMRRTVRSDVDFVITFEELAGIFEAKGIDWEEIAGDEKLDDATAAGRGYGAAGGVAGAIESCIRTYYPDVPVNIKHVEGLSECRKVLMMAKAGKCNGYLIEGMACTGGAAGGLLSPGGCIAGAGTNIPPAQANKAIEVFKADARNKIPDCNGRNEANL